MEALILAYPDYSTEFILDTKAGNVGTDAILSQLHYGTERVVAYHSKMLKETGHGNNLILLTDHFMR